MKYMNISYYVLRQSNRKTEKHNEKQYKFFFVFVEHIKGRMKTLFLLFPVIQSLFFRNPLHMIHNTDSPPKPWTFLSNNLKTSARKWFIGRAERAGVPWKASVDAYNDQYSRMSLNLWKRRLEIPDMVYPNYFTQPFHGYDQGNMEWMAAIEGEAATLSISSNYWKGANPHDAAKWMRYNVSQHIHNYCRRYHVNADQFDSILDMGCSIGISSEFLANTFHKAKHIVGVDLSPFFVAMAAYRADKYGRNIEYIHGNSEHLTLTNGTFDLITCNFLLHEVPYEPTMNILNEAYRLLKPNGILVVVDLDPDHLKTQLALNPFRRWAFEVTEPHIYQYYQNDMHMNLMVSGFSDVEKMKNDPLNSVWIGKKNLMSVQTLKTSPKKLSFAMVY